MPALDFPTSPTNGQIYGQYTYDSTKGAWRVTSPSTVNNAIISPTAPSSPVAGNIWYNSTDGNTYVYYNDGDTSQWVQLKSDATLSSTLGNRVTILEGSPIFTGQITAPNQPIIMGNITNVPSASNCTFSSSYNSGGFSSITNGTTITVPSAGRYLINFDVLVSTSGSGYFQYKRNGTVIYHSYMGGAVSTFDLRIHMMDQLAANDQITLYISSTVTSYWSSPHATFSVAKVS